MKILLCNDDGVHAPGIDALYRELKKLGDVCVVAPLEEKSTTGHSLTLHKPLRLLKMRENFFGVSGSPADCVYLGIRQVLKSKPDWVVSGVNRGANLGQDVYYSGTVSAAREACMMGIRALAVSLAVDFKKRLPEAKLHYSSAARWAVEILKQSNGVEIPEHTLLNLNVPDRALRDIKGLQLVSQGFRHYSGTVLKRRDHRGKDYFWVGGQYRGYRPQDGTDCEVVDKGYVALTPVKLDTTDHQVLASWRRRNVFFTKNR